MPPQANSCVAETLDDEKWFRVGIHKGHKGDKGHKGEGTEATEAEGGAR
jgi:hypothetical protein